MTKPKRPLGLSIEERPKSIDERSEYGHWEIDTVLLTKEKGECLLILSERKSRIEIIRLIPDKTALSITSDNGNEFSQLSEAVECPIYYCHAYARFERDNNTQDQP